MLNSVVGRPRSDPFLVDAMDAEGFGAQIGCEGGTFGKSGGIAWGTRTRGRDLGFCYFRWAG